jgi:hypothetical protein
MYPLNLIGQLGFGFEKGHPFLNEIINQIVQSSSVVSGVRFQDPKIAVWEFSGPRAFIRVVHSTLNACVFETTTQSGIDFKMQLISHLSGARQFDGIWRFMRKAFSWKNK